MDKQTIQIRKIYIQAGGHRGETPVCVQLGGLNLICQSCSAPATAAGGGFMFVGCPSIRPILENATSQ